ncbi:MAG: DUF3365 domain-containing protein [Bacteroidetes bacterium]|nr:DUF3365 domain-containing protein [Bacteroidota bacterium]
MKYLLTAAASLILAACTSPDQSASVITSEEAAANLTSVQLAVEQSVVEIDNMRSTLAKSISADEAVDAETFARVCKPVGMRMKEIAAANGWQMRQVATRFRNPANQADSVAATIIARFADNPDLDKLWIETSVDGVHGQRYFHRITVENACLACHGEKEARPAFIKEKYPNDKAHGFSDGALRGLYSVFVPEPSPAQS